VVSSSCFAAFNDKNTMSSLGEVDDTDEYQGPDGRLSSGPTGDAPDDDPVVDALTASMEAFIVNGSYPADPFPAAEATPLPPALQADEAEPTATAASDNCPHLASQEGNLVIPRSNRRRSGPATAAASAGDDGRKHTAQTAVEEEYGPKKSARRTTTVLCGRCTRPMGLYEQVGCTSAITGEICNKAIHKSCAGSEKETRTV